MLLNIIFTILISFFVFSGSAIAATAEDYYGFKPASATVHNYTITDGITSVLLTDFIGHEKPLPEGYRTDEQYQIALDVWHLEDGGKWARLWPYVPMFSREDVKGFIQAVDEPFQNTNPNPIEVAIPHLARTYEVASALSYILSPYSTDRSYSEPNLSSQWTNPGPWNTDKFWLDSDESQPGNWDDLGAVCDPKQQTISSSGDNAYDERSNTAVFKTVEINNPYYDANDPDACVKEINGVIDDSDCFVDQAVRFSPTYLKTYTPFLHAIMDRLLTGPNAVFNIFKPYSQIAEEEPENWPATGNQGEESLAYTFSGGQAEAGLKQPGQPASYYFKYLGTIHCEKEKLMAGLQPFLGGGAYEIDPQCTGGGPNLPPPTGTCDGVLFATFNPPTQTSSPGKSYFDTYIRSKLTPEVMAVYATAEKETGIPCEVFAGIHYREGGNEPNRSLVSGRFIGTPEPDAGGKVFHSLLETAIYAGDHLKSKVGSRINDIRSLTIALSLYNGGGNANCRLSTACSVAASATTPGCPSGLNCCDVACRTSCQQTTGLPFFGGPLNSYFAYPIPQSSVCPASFLEESDPYATNFYSPKHSQMYLLWCLDHTNCTPQQDARPGAATVAIEVYNMSKGQP